MGFQGKKRKERKGGNLKKGEKRKPSGREKRRERNQIQLEIIRVFETLIIKFFPFDINNN